MEPFSPWAWNCEHFVTYCLTGYRRSIQEEKAFADPAATVALLVASGGMTGLS